MDAAEALDPTGHVALSAIGRKITFDRKILRKHCDWWSVVVAVFYSRNSAGCVSFGFVLFLFCFLLAHHFERVFSVVVFS